MKKVRNKKTGEILECDTTQIADLWCVKDGVFQSMEFSSIKELVEEWEDYEEPKEINEIDVVLDAIGEYCNEHSYYSGDVKKIKILNNVEEKLKAWKRLKDKGLKVTEWSHGLYLDKTIVGRFRYEFPIDNKDDIEKDLDLLFGGKDE